VPDILDQATISPQQLSDRWQVSVEKILGLIARGELSAFNTALEVGPGRRPRWRVPLAAVEAFERRRAAVPPEPATPPAPRKQRKTAGDPIRFF
jgi:hypothetical protein